MIECLAFFLSLSCGVVANSHGRTGPALPDTMRERGNETATACTAWP